jgi:GNAT superfamily N-acetyltransferase
MNNLEDGNSKECELDGKQIIIRQINIEDISLEHDFIDHLSPETKHYRFFGAINNVSDKMLISLCDVDGKNSMAFIATALVNDQETEIGVCRYVLTEKPDVYELALTIADKWQHRGLGRLLMNHLISYAICHGVKWIYSVELADNAFMRTLSKELGMIAKTDPDDPHQVIYSLEL